MKQELFPPCRERKVRAGCPRDRREPSPQLQTHTHRWRGMHPWVAGPPLVVLCQGRQPLLLPFSSLFYKFSSRFLQVGLNPRQGMTGGWWVWGTAATSLPVPRAVGRRDSPIDLFGHRLMSCEVSLCPPRSLLQARHRAQPLAGSSRIKRHWVGQGFISPDKPGTWCWE